MRPIVYKTPASIRARCVTEGKCLIWQGGTDGNGVPRCNHGGKQVNVRRLMRSLVDGKAVPADLCVTCECGNKLCVSDACSFIATLSERAFLASARGAYSRPDAVIRSMLARRAQSKFSEAVISEIRGAEGSSREIAKRFGMSRSHAKAIRRGDSRSPLGSPFAGLGAR